MVRMLIIRFRDLSRIRSIDDIYLLLPLSTKSKLIVNVMSRGQFKMTSFPTAIYCAKPDCSSTSAPLAFGMLVNAIAAAIAAACDTVPGRARELWKSGPT